MISSMYGILAFPKPVLDTLALIYRDEWSVLKVTELVLV